MEVRANNHDVKRVNKINTIRSILACERISQREIAAQLDISWPTVLQNVRELVELGLVEEVGTFDSTGGRKARAFAPIHDACLALGLDITESHVGLALVNLVGEQLRYLREELAFQASETYFSAVREKLRAFVEQATDDPEKIVGMGISVPGIMDEDGQIMRKSLVLEVRDLPIKAFNAGLHCPATFINDGGAAGFAELRGREVKHNTVYLSLNNRVGGAILADGKVYSGDTMRASEFGHCTLVPDGKPCRCGHRGCMEAYCSASVLSALSGGDLSAFFAGVRAGTETAVQAWNEYLDWLAIGVNNLHMCYDCDVIVGGAVGGFLEEFGGNFRERLVRRSVYDTTASYLKTCQYRQDAAAMGAAMLQIEGYIQRL